jgi:predicted nucleotidyltransferase
MKKDDVIDILRANRERLEALGVAHAYLFGSVARDEATPDSDVDVMIDVAHEPFTIFKIMHVQDRLENLLDRRVDVVIRADVLQGRKLCGVVPHAVHVF